MDWRDYEPPCRLSVVDDVHLPSGGRYTGTVAGGRMEGKGTFYYKDGVVFKGCFKEGMFHGDGVMIFPCGLKVEGLWIEGRLTKEKVIFSDGLVFNPTSKWEYLNGENRRFFSEIVNGFNVEGDEKLTNENVARKIPEGLYDNGEGFYDVRTKVLYHPVTNEILRIPCRAEEAWIKKYCRRAWDEPPTPDALIHSHLCTFLKSERLKDKDVWEHFYLNDRSSEPSSTSLREEHWCERNPRKKKLSFCIKKQRTKEDIHSKKKSN